jgi:C1A family cysteine protease
MNKILLIALGVIALLGTAMFLFHHKKTPKVDDDAAEKFQAWKHKYGKKYADPDFEAYRLKVYTANLNKIENHTGTYTVAENQFMDLTKEEFKATYLGLMPKKTVGSSVHVNTGVKSGDVDWRKKGAVSKIKDQGQCGSCWAFSTTGSLESVDAVFGSGLGDFSEQQLVDCSGSYGNMGCNGGLMDYAFQYVIAKGITTESAYPYKAVDGKCKSDGGDFKISKYTDVKQGNCDDLQNAITQQPVSIGVDAETWQFYSGGIFSDCGKQLDHGVLAVGYTADYWIVKNSWGSSWGEQGYIRLKSGNTCGICNTASYPTI